MSVWRSFLSDEVGAIVSAELIAVSTLGVLGGTMGLNMLSTSVEGEFRELSHAVRSLNQSYAYTGHVSARAWTAGSCYTQRDVQQSISELDAEFVGDRAQPLEQPAQPPKKRNKKERKADKKAEVQDEAAFLQPDESTLGEPDLVAPEDDASKIETTIEPSPEA
ncbi:MAG: hypothetical protein V4719_26300 [Planctomycetota bacterium]